MYVGDGVSLTHTRARTHAQIHAHTNTHAKSRTHTHIHKQTHASSVASATATTSATAAPKTNQAVTQAIGAATMVKAEDAAVTTSADLHKIGYYVPVSTRGNRAREEGGKGEWGNPQGHARQPQGGKRQGGGLGDVERGRYRFISGYID